MSRQQHVSDWIAQGLIPADKSQEAFSIATAPPEPSEWNHFLQKTFLWTGALGMVLSISFFVAFNWNFVGRFTTFTSLELIFLSVLGLYWKQQPNNLYSKVILTTLSILVGVLLAFFGQTYQTGADPWQLFAFWALFITPWAFIARFPVLWSVWVVLLNTTVLLNKDIEWYSEPYTIFVLNTLILIGWEVSIPKYQWSQSRWPIWLLSLVSGLSIQAVVINDILDERWGFIILGVYPLWIMGIMYFYQKKRFDLFLITVAVLSLCATTITITIQMMPTWETFSFLLMGVISVAVTSTASFWLRNIHQHHLAKRNES